MGGWLRGSPGLSFQPQSVGSSSSQGEESTESILRGRGGGLFHRTEESTVNAEGEEHKGESTEVGLQCSTPLCQLSHLRER